MKQLTVFIATLILAAAASAQTGGYKAGDIATDFSLKNIDGRMVSLAGFKDAKGFIVIFTCNSCPYSVAYEDRIIALDNKYAKKGYPVIAINPNDPKVVPDDGFEEMKTRAKEKGFTFPYLVDETQQVTKTYGATRTPHVFVLQKTDKGNIVEYIGAIDNDVEDTDTNKKRYTEQAVDALLDHKKPENAFTKAIGCTIKWRKS